VFTPQLIELSQRAAELLTARGDTVSVAEGSAGGLISACLLSVAGASAYYVGGAVVYTRQASQAFVSGAVDAPHGMRGATEEFARYLARSVALRLGTTWGIGEAGAAGPANPYGDPAGHGWVAIAGTNEDARRLLTGVGVRSENMLAFATAALLLLVETVERTG